MITVFLNGKEHQTNAQTLGELVHEQGLSNAVIATALNGTFCSKNNRTSAPLKSGDEVEIVAPMQGG